MGINQKKESQQGQILLIVLMLIATALTIVFSTAFSSRLDTQTAKLEEESQKALAAAEAAIDATLANGAAVDLGTLGGDFSGFSGGTTILTTPPSKFVTPLLRGDGQYTFYLADYQLETNAFSNYWKNDITAVYFQSESTGCANNSAVELTLIKADNTIGQRYIIDPCNRIENNTGALSAGSGGSFEGTSFAYKTSAPLILTVDYKLMLVRVIGAASKIGLETAPGTPFPLQGKTIVSEAQTATGVTKRVQLFQSYPQIPADFFITSF